MAGEDYYFALAPCQQVGFQMVFANEDGSETTTLTSTMDLVFERSAIRSFGTIDLGDAFTDTHTVNMDPVHYLSASAGAPRSVSIAVVPDGFTEEEMDDYEMKARMGLDALFATEPYKTYKQYFQRVRGQRYGRQRSRHHVPRHLFRFPMGREQLWRYGSGG